jgi:hypothetical protein
MMGPVQMIIIVVFSAFTGWFISWCTLQLLFSEKAFQGRLYAWKSRMANTAGKLLQSEFESSAIIEQKISDPSLFEKLKPEIEKHVDLFLNEKLATIFPLLYKFMGEKTILQFKTAFMIEIDLLFPVVIKNYIAGLKNELRLDTIVTEKINAILVKAIRQFFVEKMGKNILYFKLACTSIGLIMGLLLVLILRFTV